KAGATTRPSPPRTHDRQQQAGRTGPTAGGRLRRAPTPGSQERIDSPRWRGLSYPGSGAIQREVWRQTMKVLIALDGSPCCNFVVDEVVRRPWPSDSVFKLITVDPPLEASLLQGSPTVLDELVIQKRAAAGKLLNDAAQKIQESVTNVTV